MIDTLVCPVLTCSRHKQPFFSKNNLQQHIHSLHSERPHKCDSCGRAFGLRYRCAAHKLECGFKFECSQCGRQLPSSQALELHVRRSRHTTKSAREQLKEARRISPEASNKKRRNGKKTPPMPRREQGAVSTAGLSRLPANLLLAPHRKQRHIRERRCLREACTQTDSVLPHPILPAPPFLSHPLYPPPLPPPHAPLLLSHTHTQTPTAVSHTESVQTSLMLSHSFPTEHAEVQTLLSNGCCSPEWSLFSQSHSDTLFDLGTQTYENLLGQELGLIDSSVQTYL